MGDLAHLQHSYLLSILCSFFALIFHVDFLLVFRLSILGWYFAGYQLGYTLLSVLVINSLISIDNHLQQSYHLSILSTLFSIGFWVGIFVLIFCADILLVFSLESLLFIRIDNHFESYTCHSNTLSSTGINVNKQTKILFLSLVPQPWIKTLDHHWN